MWLNPNGNTPSIDQVEFGADGQDVPGDGEAYCAPTSMVMGLYWLVANGFTQLADPYPGSQDDAAVVNLERVLAGLMHSSVFEGTSAKLGGEGFSTYLSARGISPDQYRTLQSSHPDLDWITAQLAPNFAENPDTIVIANVAVGWFTADVTAKTMSNDGGHVLAPLQTDPTKSTLIFNNAYPTNLAGTPNPQAAIVSRVGSGWTFYPSGILSGSSEDYCQLMTKNTPPGGSSRAILWHGESWTIQASAAAAAGHTPSPWQLAKPRRLNANGGELTVLAPLQGAGSLIKDGQGTVLLTNTNSLSGDNKVNGGLLSSNAVTGAPFGTGSIALKGNSALGLAPTGTVAIASGAGNVMAVYRGGGTLAFGGSSAFSVTIGGISGGTTGNLQRFPGASLILAMGGGLAALGGSQQVLLAGAPGNWPPHYDGMILPWVVGQDSDAASSGAFLTYDKTSGFTPVATVDSSSLPIDQANDTTIYQVTDSQSVGAGEAAAVFALEMDGGTIGGDGTLRVGSQAAKSIAGLILNGGDLGVASLDVGAAEAAIYAADTGGTTIGSTITGSAGLVLFGPGTVTLSADNSATLSGEVNVNAGTLVAAGSGSATGAGAVVVNGTATLQVSGAVSGPIFVDQAGLLDLDGGTVADVTLASAGTENSNQGGYLQGGGTVTGDAVLFAVIQSGPAAGLLEFTGTAYLSDQTSLYWRLDNLVDDSNGTPGVDWNGVKFANKPTFQSPSMALYFDFSAVGGDPDQGNAFWLQPRRWTVWQLPDGATYFPVRFEGWTFAAGQFEMAETFPYPLLWVPAQPQDVPELLRQKAAQQVRQKRPWNWRLRPTARGWSAKARSRRRQTCV